MLSYFRDDQGKFPDYPSDDEGGSASIFHPERVNNGQGAGISSRAKEDDSDEEARAKEEEAAAAAAKTRSKKDSDEKDKKGKEAEDEEEVGFQLRASEFVKQLRKGQKTFEGERESHARWYDRFIHCQPFFAGSLPRNKLNFTFILFTPSKRNMD